MPQVAQILQVQSDSFSSLAPLCLFPVVQILIVAAIVDFGIALVNGESGAK